MSRLIIVGCVNVITIDNTLNQCNSYDATHVNNQRVTSQNPLKSQDGGKKTALANGRAALFTTKRRRRPRLVFS